MEFLEKNAKGILGIAGLVVLAGLIGTLVTQNSIRKEKQTQEKFFAIDAKVKKYKEEKFKSNTKDSKDPVTPTIDVVQLKTELETFVNENIGSVASQMAALELADLLTDANQSPAGLAILQKVETKTDLLSNLLVRMKIAQTLADQDKCPEALTIWDKVLKSKASSYLHAEAKINQALCYKKLNDLAKAEEILNQVKNDKSETSVENSKEAERILRLIQYNKSFGT